MKMHVGRNKVNCATNMKVENVNLEDVEEVVYLGDTLSFDGKNTKNIKSRISKGLGIISQIFFILENTVFGPSYFEVALLLRESLLINSVLFQGEVWYGVTDKELDELSSLDRIFFSRLFQVPRTTVEESFFLETGALRIRDILRGRRVRYLHSLANRKMKESVSRIFLNQWENPCKLDWTLQVRQDLKELDMESWKLEDLRKTTKVQFKELLKKKINSTAFKELMQKKDKHSKMKSLNYDKLNCQEYLKDKDTSVEEKLVAFKWRVRMARFDENYRAGKEETQCPLCENHKDGQRESFHCPAITKAIKVEEDYEDIFKAKVSKKMIKTLTKISEIRETNLHK